MSQDFQNWSRNKKILPTARVLDQPTTVIDRKSSCIIIIIIIIAIIIIIIIIDIIIIIIIISRGQCSVDALS